MGSGAYVSNISIADSSKCFPSFNVKKSCSNSLQKPGFGAGFHSRFIVTLQIQIHGNAPPAKSPLPPPLSKKLGLG
jgi:hypothetical protein